MHHPAPSTTQALDILYELLQHISYCNIHFILHHFVSDTEVVAASEVVVTMRAHDKFGNARASGGDAVSLVIHAVRNATDPAEPVVGLPTNPAASLMQLADGRPPVVASVSDREDGSYTFRFAMSRSGQYTMNLMLDGAHLGSSPFLLTIVPLAATALMSAVLEPLQPVSTAGTTGTDHNTLVILTSQFDGTCWSDSCH